jgi:hypothetical protein
LFQKYDVGASVVPISISVTLEEIQQNSSFIIVDFDFSVFQALIDLPQEWDLHDRIIAATPKSAPIQNAKLRSTSPHIKDCSPQCRFAIETLD